MYAKQPFDNAGRTGTVVFDVSADSQDAHAAVPEFWWTDEPVPAPHASLPSQAPYGRNSFGFSIGQPHYPCDFSSATVDTMFVTRNFVLESVPLTQVDCITRGSSSGSLNHFEVRISSAHVEVWATDAGSSVLKKVATADVAMPLTRGFISIEDVHFDAGKFNTQRLHTFGWDNVGFDGPRLYRNLSFDAPDALAASPLPNTVALGYATTSPVSLSIPNVYWLQQPTGASVTFNWFADEQGVPSVRVNGGAWHDTPWPFDSVLFAWRTIAVSVPLGEIRSGTNIVEIKSVAATVISSIDISLTAASPVP